MHFCPSSSPWRRWPAFPDRLVLSVLSLWTKASKFNREHSSVRVLRTLQTNRLLAQIHVQIQQILDQGTANPIVARLSIQTQDLLPFYDLSEEQRQKIVGLMFSDIQPKLLACSRISEQFASEVRGHQKRIDEIGVEVQAASRAYKIPAIFDVRSRAEIFLYQAKSVLRDLTKLFLILFGKDFNNTARFDLVAEWAEAEFGEQDELTKMLKTDEGLWIRSLVKMRNAVEHPAGRSGTLHVQNFTAEVVGSSIVVLEPVWYLDNNEKSPVVRDMGVFTDNLLTLCEQTLILCLEKFKKGFPIVVVEVAEGDRDPSCPVRYRMTLDPSRITFPPTAAKPSNAEQNT